MGTIKLVGFDLNKTLIKENSWYYLNLALGVTESEDNDLLRRYEEGKISYLEGQKALEKIYKDRGRARRDIIESVVLKFNYLPGAREAISYLVKNGYHVVILSGSMDFLVRKVAVDLGVKLFAANNSFLYDNNGYLSEISTLGDDSVVKLIQIKQFAKQLGIQIGECAFVGDGDNDLEIFKATKHGITFSGSKIEKYAWKVIKELKEIAKIL